MLADQSVPTVFVLFPNGSRFHEHVDGTDETSGLDDRRDMNDTQPFSPFPLELRRAVDDRVIGGREEGLEMDLRTPTYSAVRIVHPSVPLDTFVKAIRRVSKSIAITQIKKNQGDRRDSSHSSTLHLLSLDSHHDDRSSDSTGGSESDSGSSLGHELERSRLEDVLFLAQHHRTTSGKALGFKADSNRDEARMSMRSDLTVQSRPGRDIDDRQAILTEMGALERSSGGGDKRQGNLIATMKFHFKPKSRGSKAWKMV